MTPIEKARAALAKERSRKEEFYEGAAYALKLAEAAQVGENEKPKTNGDRVRAMSDRKLASIFATATRKHCGFCVYGHDIVYGEKLKCKNKDIDTCVCGIEEYLGMEAER